MASSSLAVRILPEPIRSLAFGSVGASYSAIGTPLDHPGRIVLFQNATNQPIYISWDGIDDHFYLAAESFILFDFGTNRGGNASELAVSQGTQFYTKHAGSAPTDGLVAVSSLYGKE